MEAMFAILAEPARRELLDQLRVQERTVNELVELSGLSQPSVSKHLKVLREAGLVQVRQDAQRRWYRLNADPLTEIERWLAPYRAFWTNRLDALERYLETQKEQE